MADRYPLVYNPSANQLQELQSGDSLDVGNSSIKGATGYATTAGTSSQFLKADGSTDSNTYLTSAGTAALAEGLTGSPSINVSAVSGTTGTFSGAVSGTTGTFSGNVSAVNVSASSSVTAATFYGDGQNLTNTGSTLSASSGTQRVVLTGQTSGTMTSSATDSNFTYDSSSNTLNVQNLNVQGTTTTIDTAVTEVDSLQVDGNVGIGTTNATEILHVQTGTSDEITTFKVKTSGRVELSRNHADAPYIKTLMTSGNPNIILGDSVGDRVLINGHGDSYFNGGLVGIGTVNPSNMLHIEGSSPSIRLKVSDGPRHMISPFGADLYIEADNDNTSANTNIIFQVDGSEKLRINSSGHILPGADNTQDLGSSSKRFANIYTGDLNLSNEGSANDVDGTWGQYTIQEGEDDLFLINRRTGKKYKFNLTEVD